MKDYQVLERRSRDTAAPGFDTWYSRSKGRWFDIRERQIFQKSVGFAGVAVLDLGSGTGRITAALAGPRGLTAALDFSLASLRVLAGKGLGRVSAVSADGSALPFETAAFDTIVSCQVLQHFALDDLLSALRECRRVLKPGGRFFCSVYNLGYLRYGRIFEVIDENGLYYRRFNPAYVRWLALQTGFTVRNIAYYKTLPSAVAHALEFAGPRLVASIDGVLGRIPVFRKFTSAYMFIELR